MSKSSGSRLKAPQASGRAELSGELASGVDYGALLDLVGYGIRRAQIRIYADFLDVMEPWSITPPRFSAMTLIRHNVDMKLTDLSRAMGIARSGAVEVVNSLEKLGYARRCGSQTDRRAYSLELTPKGAEVLVHVTALIQRHDEKISARLSAKEREQLRKLLDKLG